MTNVFRRVFRRNNVLKDISSASKDMIIEDVPVGCRTFAFPNYETIIVVTKYGNLDVFSLRTGECLHSYKDHLGNYTRGLILLDDDTIACINRHDIVIRRLSDGAELDRTGIDAWCLAPLEDRCFLIGTVSGMVQEVQCDETGNLTLTRDVSLADSYIDDISVCRNRFAACSVKSKVIGVFELTSFKCIAVEKQQEASRLHLTVDILVVGDKEGQIFIYNSFTMEIVHKIQNHTGTMVTSVYRMGDGRHVLSAHFDGLFSVQNMETGYPIWEKQFKEYIAMTMPLSHGRHLIRLEEKLLCQKLPEHVAKLTFPLATPLRDALESCISGVNTPLEKCNKLITFDKTRTSFDEWCCAHQLLIMAVEDGDIPRTPDYNGEISWWLENLYVAAKDVQKGSEDEIRTIKRYLVEAESVGLVRSIEPIVVGMRITKDVSAEVGALQHVDILMLDRILSIEGRLKMLKESFDRYRKYVRTSQLIGVALQIIPIAGGSIAGVVSAGADIVEGISVKDMSDYILGVGSSIADDEISSMSDRVFKIAAAALSAERLEMMEAEHRRKLEEVVKAYGMNVSALKSLFVRKAKVTRKIGENSSTRPRVGGEAGVDAVEALGAETNDGIEALLLGSGTYEDHASSAAKTTRQPELDIISPRDRISRAGKNRLSLEEPSAWKYVELDKDVIRALSQEELASFLAGYLVCNNDNQQQEYEMLRKCLDSVLKEEHLRVELMVDSSVLPAEDLLYAIVNGLERNGMRVTVGISALVRKFVAIVQKE